NDYVRLVNNGVFALNDRDFVHVPRSGELAENALDLFLERGWGEGFHEVVVHAKRGRLLHDLPVGRTGQHDEDGFADNGVLADFLQELEAVHFRHVQVGDDQVHAIGPNCAQCFDSARRVAYIFEAEVLEGPADHGAHAGLIVDHHDLDCSCCWHR